MRQGHWWQQRADNVWLRWDAEAGGWVEQPEPPPPPGPMDPQQPPLHPPDVQPYRSPRPVARTLLILLGIGLGLDLIAVVSGFSERSLLERAQQGGIVSFDEAETNDTRQMFIGIGQAAVFIVTMIVFLVWFRRTYRNLGALGARSLRFKAGWAIGAWFVPFLNLFRPFNMASDIWKASNPEMTDEPGTPWQTQRSSRLLAFWWTSWVISNWTSQAAFRFSDNQQNLDQLQRMNSAWLIADVASAVATILAIAVVSKITRRQEQRAQKLASSGTLVA